jgi:DNA-binding beta-propeller fold protein YncE
LLGALVVAPACGLNQEGVAPPLNRISFPGSVKSDPDGRWLYVVNSNADLRYNSGTVVAVDVKLAADDRKGHWKVCPNADYVRPPNDNSDRCCWDYLDHNILDCDERSYINPATTIQIGSFGAGSALQTFPASPPACEPAPARPDPPKNRHDCNLPCDDGDVADGRLYIGVRGNSSLTYVDIRHDGDRVNLSCPAATSPGTAQDCTVKDMRETTTAFGGTLQPTVVPDEPYTLQLDLDQDLLYVGHLRADLTRADTGGISIFDIAKASTDEKPVFLRTSGRVFPGDPNGNSGVTSLSMTRGRLYATSRYLPWAMRVATPVPTLTCTMPDSERDTFAISPSSEIYVSPLVGLETRGIQFLPPRQNVNAPATPGRAFVLQRTPPAVVSFDAAMGEEGVYGNFPSEVIEVCQAPTFLQRDRTDDEQDAGAEDTLLYVSCFDQGQVYLIDPSVPRLVAIIDVGRGPAGLDFPRQRPGETERVAYVVGFGSNNVGVLDLTDGSPTQYHIIQRIGFPSVVPR